MPIPEQIKTVQVTVTLEVWEKLRALWQQAGRGKFSAYAAAVLTNHAETTPLQNQKLPTDPF